MEIYLKNYKRTDEIRKFDIITGSVSSKIIAPVEIDHWGFVWKQGRKWYAIRRAEKHLIFQHNDKIFPMMNPFLYSVSGGFFRTFSIFEGKTKVFCVKYKSYNYFHQMFDPTFDAIDAELGDFFLYITSMAESWSDKNINKFQFDR